MTFLHEILFHAFYYKQKLVYFKNVNLNILKEFSHPENSKFYDGQIKLVHTNCI